MSRPSVISCAVFGGRSPKTGKLVGERHKWSGGAWGEGTCIYCRRDLEQVQKRPAKDLSLDQSIARDQARAAEADWHPIFWDGKHGIAKGWYVTRKRPGGGSEWLKDADGLTVLRDTEDEARAAIPGPAQRDLAAGR